jgi:hypothetical protein
LKMAAGRFFDYEDTPNSKTAVIVNRAFAQLYSSDSHNPAAILGTDLFGSSRDHDDGQSATVIGVLEDQRQEKVQNPAQPEIDICIPQITPKNMFYKATEEVAMDLAVRSDEPPSLLIPQLREILKRTSPEFARAKITTMDQIVKDSYGNQQFAAHLLQIFGGLALLLSTTGLYALLSCVVAQRTREIGLRIALGAARTNVLWLVLRGAGVMLMAGVMAGTIVGLAASRLMRSYLYGVSSHDTITLAGSATLLFSAGILAAFLPAQRATRADPMEALRTE